jgi:hypothetical protein
MGGFGVEFRGMLVWFSSLSSPTCSIGLVCIDNASRERDAEGFRLGLLRFLTRLSVLLNIIAVLRS